MRNRFPALHDAHDGGLRFEIAVGGDAFVRLLVFGLGFFGLDLVDLDAVFGVGEGEVYIEGVIDVDVFAFWVFAQDAVAGAGEGLQGSFEFGVVYLLSAMLLGVLYLRVDCGSPRPEAAFRSA